MVVPRNVLRSPQRNHCRMAWSYGLINRTNSDPWQRSHRRCGDLGQLLLTLAVYYYLWSSFHAWFSPAASDTIERSEMRWFVRLGSSRSANDCLLDIRKINSLLAGDLKPKASYACSISSILCNNRRLSSQKYYHESIRLLGSFNPGCPTL